LDGIYIIIKGIRLFLVVVGDGIIPRAMMMMSIWEMMRRISSPSMMQQQATPTKLDGKTA